MKQFFLSLVVWLSSATLAIANQSFIFSPEDLTDISLKAQNEVKEELKGLSEDELLGQALALFHIKDELKKSVEKERLLKAYETEKILMVTEEMFRQRYPGKILDKTTWIWNNVGGIYARTKVLYCSLKEYVVLFGSQLAQEGFSGHYPYMDVYDVMLTGKMDSHEAKATEAFPVTYGPQDVSLLIKGASRYYNMQEFTYMIDYGRGQVTRALFTGVISPYLFSNSDAVSLKVQLKDCMKSTLGNLGK